MIAWGQILAAVDVVALVMATVVVAWQLAHKTKFQHKPFPHRVVAWGQILAAVDLAWQPATHRPKFQQGPCPRRMVAWGQILAAVDVVALVVATVVVAWQLAHKTTPQQGPFPHRVVAWGQILAAVDLAWQPATHRPKFQQRPCPPRMIAWGQILAAVDVMALVVATVVVAWQLARKPKFQQKLCRSGRGGSGCRVGG